MIKVDIDISVPYNMPMKRRITKRIHIAVTHKKNFRWPSVHASLDKLSIQIPNSYLNSEVGVGEMVQQVIVFIAVADGLGSSPSTHVLSHNHL